jgi:hypothetical protein
MTWERLAWLAALPSGTVVDTRDPAWGLGLRDRVGRGAPMASTVAAMAGRARRLRQVGCSKVNC